MLDYVAAWRSNKQLNVYGLSTSSVDRPLPQTPAGQYNGGRHLTSYHTRIYIKLPCPATTRTIGKRRPVDCIVTTCRLLNYSALDTVAATPSITSHTEAFTRTKSRQFIIVTCVCL